MIDEDDVVRVAIREPLETELNQLTGRQLREDGVGWVHDALGRDPLLDPNDIAVNLAIERYRGFHVMRRVRPEDHDRIRCNLGRNRRKLDNFLHLGPNLRLGRQPPRRARPRRVLTETAMKLAGSPGLRGVDSYLPPRLHRCDVRLAGHPPRRALPRRLRASAN